MMRMCIFRVMPGGAALIEFFKQDITPTSHMPLTDVQFLKYVSVISTLCLCVVCCAPQPYNYIISCENKTCTPITSKSFWFFGARWKKRAINSRTSNLNSKRFSSLPANCYALKAFHPFLHSLNLFDEIILFY